MQAFSYPWTHLPEPAEVPEHAVRRHFGVERSRGSGYTTLRATGEVTNRFERNSDSTRTTIASIDPRFGECTLEVICITEPNTRLGLSSGPGVDAINLSFGDVEIPALSSGADERHWQLDARDIDAVQLGPEPRPWRLMVTGHNWPVATRFILAPARLYGLPDGN